MKHFTNFRWLLLSLLLAVGTGSAWGQTTDTYIFTSKSWGATLNGSTSNWTSGQDGGQLTSGQGIQVTTTYSGANGTSPISYTNVSKVVVTYCTNNKNGVGSIAVKIGNNSATSQNVTKPSSGGTTLKTFEYNYSTTQSGNVNVEVTCTTNSIYIYSVAITYNNGNTAASTTTTIDATGITNTNLANGTAAGSLSASVTSGGNAVSGATVTWSSSDTGVATINSSGVVTLVGAGTTTITASYAGVTDEYEASSATYSLTVTNFTPTDGTFDFTGTYDYGSGLTPSSNSSTYIEESKTWTSGNVTLVTDGKYRWWSASGGNSLRVYTASSGSTTLTLSVPSGKVIKGITITGSNLDGITADVGTYSSGTWTGSSQTVVFTRSSANTYFSTITVTYEDGSAPVAAATTTTIDSSGITNTDVYTSTAAGALSATVTSGGSTISGATVTWSSSNESVATVASDGTVTLVGAGTTTITASYAGVSGTYEASSATYTLTVTDSTPANQLVTVDSEGNVTFLFNDTGWGLPEGSGNKTGATNTYTNSGYTITLGGDTSNGYYYNTTGYLLMGKSGAYLQLPAFDFDVERIEVTGTNTASESVIQNIYVGDEAVSTATTGAKGVTNSYTVASAYQSAGNVYKLQVTSAHNTQFTQIKVIKKSTTPSLSFSTASANVYVGGTYTQTVNAYNTGENTITYATSNAEIASINTSTGEVTGVTTGTVTITASVTVESVVYTATYEVTVVKNDAELSFETPVVTKTVGETYAGQTVTKPADITDAEITYSSNNPVVASVDASTGAITLGGGIGTATITATFAGNTKYNAATATYTLKVQDASAVSGDYEKITSTDDLTDGEYLIVYEDGPVAFDGSLTTLDANGNKTDVTIDTNSEPYTIVSTSEVDAAAFTITAIDGGYSICSANGYYIGSTAAASGNNELKTSTTTEYVNTISFDEDGNVVITGTDHILRYNSDSGALRFRYFKSGTYTSQKAIQLYKKSSSSVTVATPVISPETGTYTERPQTVTITCSTVPASGETLTIYYTTDGTTPTTNSSVYTAPFNISKNTTVQAIAVLNTGGANVVSRVASSVITMSVNAPVFSPVDGSSFDEAYQVTISADEGLTIYYIAQDNKIFKTAAGGRTATYSESNGELVSTALVYSSALTFGQSMMVTAICMDSDGNLSDPVTVQYTFTGSIEPPYFSSFSASEGDFVNTQTEDGNTITGNGAPYWEMQSNTGADAIEKWGEERYYMRVRGTSGNTNQNRTRWYGTADLTSPLINLTGKGNASFSFIHAGHHFYSDPNTAASGTDNTLETTLSASTAGSPVRTSCHVYIDDYGTDGSSLVSSTDVSNDVNWFEQAFRSDIANSSNPKTLASSSTTSRSGSFPRSNSGDISLSGYENHYIKIRFSYTSNSSSYGTWNIDQVTVNAVDVEEMTMNSKGWTTYVFDHDIDAYTTTQNYISGGEETLKIYKVTEFDNDEVVLQQLGKYEEYSTANNSERYIPAKTPVVIEGPAGATIDFVEYSAPSMLPTVKNNLLYASLSPNLVTATEETRYYVLQWNSTKNEPMFNRLKTSRQVPDHKAYLNGVDEIDQVSTKTNSVKGIYVLGGDGEDIATSIEEMDVTQKAVKDGVFYNLAGQRVQNPTRGLYIVNGKKVYLK